MLGISTSSFHNGACGTKCHIILCAASSCRYIIWKKYHAHDSLPNVFFRTIGPPRKQTGPNTSLDQACLVWSQKRGVSYNQDQRGKVRARQADAGTGDSSNGRERKGPGGRSGDSQSRLTTRAVNTEEQKAEWDSSPDIWKWHKDVRSGNMLLAGILLVGFFGQCLFFSYLTLANGTITFSHYLSPKCITIFTRRQSGILRTHDIREWMWVRPSFPANNIV